MFEPGFAELPSRRKLNCDDCFQTLPSIFKPHPSITGMRAYCNGCNAQFVFQ